MITSPSLRFGRPSSGDGRSTPQLRLSAHEPAPSRAASRAPGPAGYARAISLLFHHSNTSPSCFQGPMHGRSRPRSQCRGRGSPPAVFGPQVGHGRRAESSGPGSEDSGSVRASAVVVGVIVAAAHGRTVGRRAFHRDAAVEEGPAVLTLTAAVSSTASTHFHYLRVERCLWNFFRPPAAGGEPYGAAVHGPAHRHYGSACVGNPPDRSSNPSYAGAKHVTKILTDRQGLQRIPARRLPFDGLGPARSPQPGARDHRLRVRPRRSGAGARGEGPRLPAQARGRPGPARGPHGPGPAKRTIAPLRFFFGAGVGAAIGKLQHVIPWRAMKSVTTRNTTAIVAGGGIRTWPGRRRRRR